MAGAVQLLDTDPYADIALLKRVAAGIRALGSAVAPCPPSPDDQDLFRHEVDRAVNRLRSDDIEVVRYAG
jgi:hypothetical protein